MKKLVRNSVYETNSSSCHSLSIGKQDGLDLAYDTIYPNELGNIILTGGQYGRTFFKTNDPLEKANYLAVATLYGYSKEDFIQCIKNHTQCEQVILQVSDEYGHDNFSYIDHESVRNTPEKKDLKDFIFNKNSWLYIAHDEAYPPIDFYKNDIYKSNGEIEKLNQPYSFVIYDKSGDEIEKLCFSSQEPVDDELVRKHFSDLDPEFINDENHFYVDNRYYSSRDKHFKYSHLTDKHVIFGLEFDYHRLPDEVQKLSWNKIDKWKKQQIDKPENHIKLDYKIEYNG